MIRTRQAVIIITPKYGDTHPEVYVHGDLAPHLIDLGLDEARRQIGMYEETPLDRFVRENDLKMTVYATRQDGIYRASLEASLKDPTDPWGLLLSSTEGRTPAEARRKLTELISGGTLVLGACLPGSRKLPVPDLLSSAETRETRPEA